MSPASTTPEDVQIALTDAKNDVIGVNTEGLPIATESNHGGPPTTHDVVRRLLVRLTTTKNGP